MRCSGEDVEGGAAVLRAQHLLYSVVRGGCTLCSSFCPSLQSLISFSHSFIVLILHVVDSLSLNSHYITSHTRIDSRQVRPLPRAPPLARCGALHSLLRHVQSLLTQPPPRRRGAVTAVSSHRRVVPPSKPTRTRCASARVSTVSAPSSASSATTTTTRSPNSSSACWSLPAPTTRNRFARGCCTRWRSTWT